MSTGNSQLYGEWRGSLLVIEMEIVVSNRNGLRFIYLSMSRVSRYRLRKVRRNLNTLSRYNKYMVTK